jgi:hypothetical protein
MGTRSSIGVPVWIQVGFLAVLGIFGFVYANRPEHWRTLRNDLATERTIIQSYAYRGLDGQYLLDAWKTGAPGPLETLQIREARMGWNLRDAHPRLWENYLDRVEHHSPGEAVHLEYLMEAMDREFELVVKPWRSQSKPKFRLRYMEWWSFIDKANRGMGEEMRVVCEPSLSTARIDRFLTVGSSETTATIPLTVASGGPAMNPGLGYDYWYYLTTEADPDQSDLRRLPAIWQRQGEDWVLVVDLINEPGWIHPEAHISELIFARTPRKQ